MYAGYLSFGGNVVINNDLTTGYAASYGCPLMWYDGPGCEGMNDALEEGWPYSGYPAEELPWYDAKLSSQSSRFMGVYGIDIGLVQDSTRSVALTEGIVDGGVIGRTRKGMKRMRLHAVLIGEGRDALDYGMAWLNAVIDPDACGQVSEKCGTADLDWFVECPPARDSFDPPLSDSAYQSRIDGLRRFMRTSAAEVGGIVISEFDRNGFFGYEVEVTFVSETPHILGMPQTYPLNPNTPSVVQDIVYNLVPTPSAELASGEVVVQTNYATNPSVESNTTDWSASVNAELSAAGAVTLARVTTIAAQGVASARSRFVSTAAGIDGRLRVQHAVALTGPAGATYSFNMWATLALISGTAALNGIRFRAVWRDAANAEFGNTLIGEVPTAGGAVSSRNVVPPIGATSCLVRAEGYIDSWASGATIDIYGDAVAVTVP
jgi:hypothetical protein